MRLLKSIKHHSPFIIMMVSAIIISACSYQPVSKYAKNLLPDPVYVDVKLSGVEPQNGVYLKDEILRVLTTRFHERSVSDRASSASQILVPAYSFEYTPLSYDKNGYVTQYRVQSNITFHLITAKGEEKRLIHTSEDVSIQPGSLTSFAARDAAIRVAIRKAMDKFIAYLAQKGYGK